MQPLISNNRPYSSQHSRLSSCKRLVMGFLIFASFAPLSALAHHPLDGRLPQTMMEGLLSGIGHPVIGLDHLAFIVAVGLLATFTRLGLLIPVGFVLGSLVGITLHLQLFTLPFAELLIAASVVTIGVLLSMDRRMDYRASALLGTTAGVFHGYAYAEAIVGANMGALASYLAGLTIIQLSISLGCFYLATRLINSESLSSFRPLRMAGLAITSVGTVLLTLAALG